MLTLLFLSCKSVYFFFKSIIVKNYIIQQAGLGWFPKVVYLWLVCFLKLIVRGPVFTLRAYYFTSVPALKWCGLFYFYAFVAVRSVSLHSQVWCYNWYYSSSVSLCVQAFWKSQIHNLIFIMYTKKSCWTTAHTLTEHHVISTEWGGATLVRGTGREVESESVGHFVFSQQQKESMWVLKRGESFLTK